MKNFYSGLLISVPGIGRNKFSKLVNAFGSAQEAWHSETKLIQRIGCLTNKEADQFDEYRKMVSLEKLLREWSQKGISILTEEDETYPNLLRRIYDPPAVLFIRGVIVPNFTGVAVVGSRRCSAYGKNVARTVSYELAKAGVVVVSGGARGIDTHAHRGAVECGKTIAVLGCGVDVVYPPENTELFESIMQNGCLVSEYAPGTLPLPGQFPARNRIVAGMCPSLVVVEAPEKSGALITADFAMNENREVYAVPGTIFSTSSTGTNRLIQQGARLLLNPHEILEDLGLQFTGRLNDSGFLQCEEDMVVLTNIPYDSSISADELLQIIQLDAAEMQVKLLQLEIGGYIEVVGTNRYTRITKEWKHG
jgi:DNA processing protein